MKRYLTLLFLIGFYWTANGQSGALDGLIIKETHYDFGKIPLGKPVTHTFEVVNSGKLPLQIENVQASCGCTTPEWSKEAIAPGAMQQIQVGYNAAVSGVFEKTITIFYNSGKTKQLNIKGEVWKAPTTPAPANAAIQLLKNINH